MPLDFLTRPLEILTGDGSLEPCGISEVAIGSPTVLIARERCRFELFTAPEGLRGSAAAAAARTFAQTRAPYDDAGSLITRQGPRFGVWWWDAGALAGDLSRLDVGSGVRAWPEAMAQPEGHGWRIVRGHAGYEAQLWEDGFLVGSMWRRRAFDAQSWAAFTRVYDTALPRPEMPPAAAPLPYTFRSDYRRTIISASSAQGLLPLLATSGAALLVCATALMLGQGLALSQQRKQVEEELTLARQHAQASQRPRLSAEAARLQTLADATNRPNPLVLVAAAQRILAPFRLKISAFSADSSELTLTIPAEAVAGIDLVTQELESSPYFSDIRPTLDRQKKQLTIRMAVRGSHASGITKAE